MRVIRVDAVAPFLSRETFGEIASHLEGGGIVVYPTDTLYALGARICDAAAIGRVHALKGRSTTASPSAFAFASLGDAARYCELTPLARAIGEEFLPGPVTMLLRSRAPIPGAAMEGDLLGVRVPGSGAALSLIGEVGPLTCTSANRHGAPAPSTVEGAIEQLGEGMGIYIDGGPTPYSGPSTVVDCSGDSIKVIREGVVSRERLSEL